MNTISIVLADNHTVVRQGVRALLESEPDCSVVGEAADGIDALDTTERLKPDVLILELSLPTLHGLEVIRQVKQRVPETRVLVLSSLANEDHVLKALRNGASGYCLKESDAKAVEQAVRTVAAGERYLSQPLWDPVIAAYINADEPQIRDRYESLTARERQVLQMAAEGTTSAEIAQRLSISRRTVEVHRARALHKLNLHTQNDLIFYAIRKGFLTVDP